LLQGGCCRPHDLPRIGHTFPGCGALSVQIQIEHTSLRLPPAPQQAHPLEFVGSGGPAGVVPSSAARARGPTDLLLAWLESGPHTSPAPPHPRLPALQA
jgi:hypothetical protein